MSALRALQQALQGQILQPANLASANETPLLEARRVQIYTTAYRLRLLEALQTDYTALHAALGDEAFEKLAYDFISATPSIYPNLRCYGAELDSYLQIHAPYRDQPILAELARFEWAMGLAFDAADHAVVTINDLRAIPAVTWPQLRFRPHPSVQRLSLCTNAPLIWKAVAQETPPPPSETSVDATVWLVWRQDLNVFFRSLSSAEARAWDSLMVGATFGHICESLAGDQDANEVAQRAASLLKTWVEQQLLHQVGIA